MISIVIPCHNAASTIKDAYQSIPEAGKTSLELEIIFADDGSSDDTPGLLQLIADSDMRVKVVSNERNLGVSEARNKAIEAARGELIFFIDADDKLRPGALEIMAREMTEDVDFVRAKHYLWDPASGKHTENIGEELNFPELHAVRPDQFPQMSAIYSSWNALLRRSLIMDSGLSFSPDLKLGEDRLFNLRYIMACRKITLLNEYTYLWRKPTGESQQATQVLVKKPEDVFRSIRHFSEEATGKWFSRNPRHRRVLASAMVVELANFLASFSKQIDQNIFPKQAREDIAAAFSALQPDWIDLELRGLKGRTDVFVPLYELTAAKLGTAPDENFYKMFMKQLGEIRKILEAQSAEKGADARPRHEHAAKLLSRVFTTARQDRPEEVLIAERRLISGSNAFDKEHYRRNNPDVVAAGVGELDHFLNFGAGEQRSPNTWFDIARYFDEHPEVLLSGINPLAHYLITSPHHRMWNV
jgi:glycosyltransferase involved in cell wall biosynthesis